MIYILYRAKPVTEKKRSGFEVQGERRESKPVTEKKRSGFEVQGERKASKPVTEKKRSGFEVHGERKGRNNNGFRKINCQQ